ncbi:MAG: hypothetical protein U5R30_19470 [Deltaproteobacteria bacterium]|nr:hypothetical protein [Deltaproteobacteria bacterium]
MSVSCIAGRGRARTGVIDAVALPARAVNLGSRGQNRQGSVRQAVGGGNVAIDAARAAIRLGSRSVTVVYRRSEREMPAYVDEIEGALPRGRST